MKKRIILVVTAILALSLVLSACGKKDNATSTPPLTQQPEEQTPDAQAPMDDESLTLSKISDMLNKADDDVKDLFGGGTENKTEDGSIIIGRSYNSKYNGKDVMFDTVYSDKNTVDAITISFKDTSFDELKNMFTEEYGEPTIVDNTDDMDTKFYKWSNDTVEITLNESYGMASAEMTLLKK